MTRPLYRLRCYCPAGCIGACITCLAWSRTIRGIDARREAWRTAA